MNSDPFNNLENFLEGEGYCIETDVVDIVAGNNASELRKSTDGFSYDSTGTRYGTLYSWSRTYGISHSTLYRGIEGKGLLTYHGHDASNRSSDALYSEADMVPICVELYRQSSLPTLSDDQTVSIRGHTYITRQGFALIHPDITWPRINRWAQEIQKNQGIKMAKYKPPTTIAAHYYPVYRLSALEAYLSKNNTKDIKTLTTLTGEIGDRLGTIPHWADYLHIGPESLRKLLKNTSPTREVIVANNRVQAAYSEDVILDVMQKLCLSSAGNITIHTLEDWLLLPHAGTTDERGVLIPEEMRKEQGNLVDTATGWAQEFPISEDALGQLIKRRKHKIAAIFGRSATRVVHLYTRNTISEILDGKRPWGTQRKNKSR